MSTSNKNYALLLSTENTSVNNKPTVHLLANLKSVKHVTCLLWIICECFRITDFTVRKAFQLYMHSHRTVNVDIAICRRAKHYCILHITKEHTV